MLELDNAKDQVMTVFKLALANLGMWLRERCFPHNYTGCSWERLVPFFSLGGWVQEVKEVVRVELERFNNRKLNFDLALVCEKINQEELLLPDGRRLVVAFKSESTQPNATGLAPPAVVPFYPVTSKVA